MADKPTTAGGYESEQVELVRATCLYVATKLGDLMDDLVRIGGSHPRENLQSLPEDRGGKLRDIEPDFAAVIAPGLHLAFQDRQQITLSGQTLVGEKAKRPIWVCGPGAYVVLKALAFRSRGENKDAYDLFYLVRNYGQGVDAVAERLESMLGDQSAQQAIDILREDFQEHDGVGPRRVAEFILGTADDDTQADVVGFIGQLLEAIDEE